MFAKKLTALLLVLIMALGFAACGGTAETPDVLDDPTNVQTPGTPETPDAPETPETPDAPEVTVEPWDGDYENATFEDVFKYGVGSVNWDGSLPLTTTGESLSIGIRTQTKVTDWQENPLTKWLMEKTGLTFEFQIFAGSASDVVTQLMLMFSGGEELPDIVTTDGMTSDQRTELVDEGYVANLAGYFIGDAYYMKQAMDLACQGDEVKRMVLTENLQQYTASLQSLLVYGTPTFTDCPTDVINTECVINKDWLNKLGLQKPTTVEELYDVLVAFRDKDPNGNGKKDEIPFVGMRDTLGRGFENFLITPFIQYALNNKAMFEDGKSFSPYIEDEYRQALIFCNKLVQEGLLSDMTFTIGGTELIRLLNPAAGEVQTVGMATLWITNDFKETSTAIDSYEPVAALKDATGRGGYSYFDPITVRSRWSIPADCEKVQLAFRFLDFLYSPDAYMRQRYGEEGVDWDWIENTEHKNNAKGNGIWGGDASYVLYTDSQRVNSRWFAAYNTFQDEHNYQAYIAPDDNSFAAKRYRLSAENVALQMAVGEPEHEMHVMRRTPDEDVLYWETNLEIASYYKKAKNEFCMGMRDPNSDADWQAYLDDLDRLQIKECFIEIGQNVYDRWLANLEAAGLR